MNCVFFFSVGDGGDGDGEDAESESVGTARQEEKF